MNFEHFYKTWTDQLRQFMDQLAQGPRPPSTKEDHDSLRQLVHKIGAHFAEYYRVKSLAAKQDVFGVLATPWATALERSLHWIAGWRPTTAFHLIYTESSLLFESHVVSILRGLRTGDLGDLTPEQFRRVSELQCETVNQENAITDELSEWQDSSSDLLSKSPNIDEKMERLVRIVEKADDLRLRTVQKVLDLLSPQQAVEFLIGAMELQFGIHTWGLNHECGRRNLNN